VTPPDAAPVDDPSRCHPCRGTGRVISNKGGTPHDVECPWCEGTGRFIPEHDAQAVRAAAASAAS
jgi:DnaJ-class molecular chaperone